MTSSMVEKGKKNRSRKEEKSYLNFFLLCNFCFIDFHYGDGGGSKMLKLLFYVADGIKLMKKKQKSQ